jgi:hypothetical protein
MAVSADSGSDKGLIAIDLSCCDLAHSASLVRQACLDGGFFYVINHGIRQELFEELFDRSRTFFQLPLEEKMKALKNENFRGYTPLMDQMLDPSKQTKVHSLSTLGTCLSDGLMEFSDLLCIEFYYLARSVIRWHISCNQVLTVLWSAFQLVIQRVILPSIFLSNMGIIWHNDTRTRTVT